MNRTIMLGMADFLENLEEERFNMEFWISQYYIDEDNEKLIEAGNFIDINDCNTAGCIAGWTIAVFNGGSYDSSELQEIKRKYYSKGAVEHYPANLYSEADIAKQILGLTEKESRRLFYAGQDSIFFDLRFEYPEILCSDTGESLSVRYPEDWNSFDDRFNPVYIDYNSITPKIAGSILRKIANDEVILEIAV